MSLIIQAPTQGAPVRRIFTFLIHNDACSGFAMQAVEADTYTHARDAMQPLLAAHHRICGLASTTPATPQKNLI